MNVLLILTIFVALQGPAKMNQPSKPDSILSRVRETEVKLARVEAMAEALKSQLEVERSSARREIDTLLFLLKFGSVVITVVIGTVGIMGYRDLKGSIVDQVNRATNLALKENLPSIVEPELDRKLKEWDTKFAALLTRVVRLGGGA
jgi:hypothetical protein